MKKKLLIQGMNCGNCVRHVKEAVMELEGAVSVEVDLSSKTAIVEGNLEDSKVKFAIEDAGYEVVSIENI